MRKAKQDKELRCVQVSRWELDCGGGQRRLPAKMWGQRLGEGERNSLEEWFLQRGLGGGLKCQPPRMFEKVTDLTDGLVCGLSLLLEYP